MARGYLGEVKVREFSVTSQDCFPREFSKRAPPSPQPSADVMDMYIYICMVVAMSRRMVVLRSKSECSGFWVVVVVVVVVAVVVVAMLRRMVVLQGKSECSRLWSWLWSWLWLPRWLWPCCVGWWCCEVKVNVLGCGRGCGRGCGCRGGCGHVASDCGFAK